MKLYEEEKDELRLAFHAILGSEDPEDRQVYIEAIISKCDELTCLSMTADEQRCIRKLLSKCGVINNDFREVALTEILIESLNESGVQGLIRELESVQLKDCWVA